MDHTVAYLVYHAKLLETSPRRRVCLVPSSLFGAMKQIEHASSTCTPAALANKTPEQLQQLLLQRNLVWAEQEPPTRIILPVIDHQHTHCYLWYGDIKQRRDRKLFNCKLKYLDSLKRPSGILLAERFSLVKTMINTLVPQINGNVTYEYEHISGYNQAPGSTDCGYFVCQAVSALSFYRDDALQALQPVASVKANIKRILESCADKALLKLRNGLVAKEPIVLHSPHRTAPPPWRASEAARPATPPSGKKLLTWTSPEHTRSLSEPRETYRSLRERQSTPLSWETIFGPMPPSDFRQIDPDSTGLYLQRLRDHSYELPLGVLDGVSGSAPDYFLEALLLRRGKTARPRWLPGVSIVDGGDEEKLERREDCLGIHATCETLSHLRAGQERSLAVLTGTNAGHHIRVDWTKDSLDYKEEWLSASLDVDSLSLTATDPEFTMPAVLHAYPARASTLTTKNHLFVKVYNVKTPLSHSRFDNSTMHPGYLTKHNLVPNFNFLTIGQNNQFRVNIFFPHYEKGRDKGGRHITIMNKDDYETWYEQVVLQAMQRLSWHCPPALRDTYIRLNTELPKTYSSAEAHCTSGGIRTFTGYKVMPQILNLLLRHCRAIVSDTPSLARFGDFFYHIYGMNLKAVCEVIPERSKGNPMLHVLQQYPIVDWSAQNYRDIAVDIGLEIGVCRERLPQDIDDITLVWDLDALRKLVASSWRQPDMDSYAHSHVVGGLSAEPRSHVAPWFYYIHFYMKDKTLTYIHCDNSIGTGFSPEQGIFAAQQYKNQTQRLQEVWADGCGSYGGRVEWRVGLRTANEILQRPADLWLKRFICGDAIVSMRFLFSPLFRYSSRS